MRAFLRRRDSRGLVRIHIWCLALTCPLWLDASEQATKYRAWPRVHIEDAFTRAAVEWALSGAARWLTDERCLGLLSEFRDEADRPLVERLEALGLDTQSYLELILFRDGSGSPQCAGDLTFAVTTPRGRVIFVCGRRFERLWRRDASAAYAVIIHEVLHTLGLGENPPPGEAITLRVLALCDPRRRSERRVLRQKGSDVGFGMVDGLRELAMSATRCLGRPWRIRVERSAHRRRSHSRCHGRTVSGCTTINAVRHSRHAAASRIQKR